jgi:creatinine amidohydrolase
MSHACELETSLYLAIEPELVQMDRATREIPVWNENVYNEWPDGGPLSFWPHWSAFTESGVMGDATVATAEKGAALLRRAQHEAAEFIAEVSRHPHSPGRDHHEEPDHARR